jgi:hypothetical protein
MWKSLIAPFVETWLKRRGEKGPRAQLRILRASYKRQEEKGIYLDQTEAREITRLPVNKFDLALAELEELGELRVDRTWSGNFLIVTNKGKLSLLRKRRRRDV